MRTKNTRTNVLRREIPGENPETSRLLAICTALAGELSVVRERLDTLERLSEKAGIFSRSDVELYQPEMAVAAERDGLRRQLLGRIFRPLKADMARQAAELKASAETGAGLIDSTPAKGP